MFEQECYCAQYKGAELANSTSGGVFFAFAKYIIEQGGCVYGAAFCNFPQLKHICVERIQELSQIQGSKYVESDFINVFSDLKKRVESGQLVLFSGTPCQIAAVRSFLKQDYSNILLMDILCHGTPSKSLFSEYINWREKKWKKSILNYEFRNKRVSKWGSEQKALVTTNKGEYIIPAVCDPYFSAFQKGLIAQKKCYSCKYASPIRISDITAADFWGARLYHPNFPYDKGASCLLVNSLKGKVFFEHIKDSFLLEKSSFDKARKYNRHFNHPLNPSPVQMKIYDKLENKEDFSKILPLIPYQSHIFYVIKSFICSCRDMLKEIVKKYSPWSTKSENEIE